MLDKSIADTDIRLIFVHPTYSEPLCCSVSIKAFIRMIPKVAVVFDSDITS